MSHVTRLRTAAVVAVLGAVALGTTGSAPAQTVGGADAAITAKGVGLVKLGKTYAKLRDQRQVGRIRPGCELGGPNTRSASLRSPLKGSVDFTQTASRRVANITIRGGATAKGVGIGATIPDIQAQFPRAVVDHNTDETFGVTLVRIPKSDGGRFHFAVSTSTGKVTEIGIPFIAFCE